MIFLEKASKRKKKLHNVSQITKPCLVTVTIPGSIKDHMLIQRYQQMQMVEELYCAPKEEVIMGSFLEQIVPTGEELRPKKKKTTSTTKKIE